MIWEPYSDDVIATLPDYCIKGKEIWRSVSPLICYAIVEWHLPDRVMRQFGFMQGIPPSFDTSVDLHKTDERGRVGYNWVEVYVAFISQWNKRHETIAQADPLIDHVTYDNPYFVWYRRITRRYIVPPPVHVRHAGALPYASLLHIVGNSLAKINALARKLVEDPHHTHPASVEILTLSETTLQSIKQDQRLRVDPLEVQPPPIAAIPRAPGRGVVRRRNMTREPPTSTSSAPTTTSPPRTNTSPPPNTSLAPLSTTSPPHTTSTVALPTTSPPRTTTSPPRTTTYPPPTTSIAPLSTTPPPTISTTSLPTPSPPRPTPSPLISTTTPPTTSRAPLPTTYLHHSITSPPPTSSTSPVHATSPPRARTYELRSTTPPRATTYALRSTTPPAASKSHSFVSMLTSSSPHLDMLTDDLPPFGAPHSASQTGPLPISTPLPTVSSSPVAEVLTQLATIEVVDTTTIAIGRGAGKGRGRGRGKGRGRGRGAGRVGIEAVDAHVGADHEGDERPKRKRKQPACGT